MTMPGEMVVPRSLEFAADDEDERLWRAAARGERSAFEELVGRHRARLASIAGRLLDNPDDVQDAVQETFLRAYQQLSRFRGECGIRGWLISITLNVCRTRRRGLGRWRRFLAERGSFLLPGTRNPAAEAEERVAYGDLQRAVALLPERLREPFVLRFYEGLTGVEIAAALGCNESTVWSRIHTAQKQLRLRLQECGAPPKRSTR